MDIMKQRRGNLLDANDELGKGKIHLKKNYDTQSVGDRYHLNFLTQGWFIPLAS